MSASDEPTAAGRLIAPFQIDYSLGLGAGPPPRPLRDSLPTLRATSFGDWNPYDQNDPRTIEMHRKREERVAAIRARWQPTYDALLAASDGLVGRLVRMHRPQLELHDPGDPPDCAYCTDWDDYGSRSPTWPCPETRMLAAELGVELPPGSDEDDD